MKNTSYKVIPLSRRDGLDLTDYNLTQKYFKGSKACLYKILKRIGFIESNQERYFCLKTFKSNYDYLYDISNWLLVEGDAEIY
jgi:hypothetical protein